MGQLMTWLKLLFKNFIAMYSEPDPIHDLGDYRKLAEKRVSLYLTRIHKRRSKT